MTVKRIDQVLFVFSFIGFFHDVATLFLVFLTDFFSGYSDSVNCRLILIYTCLNLNDEQYSIFIRLK